MESLAYLIALGLEGAVGGVLWHFLDDEEASPFALGAIALVIAVTLILFFAFGDPYAIDNELIP